MVTRKYTKDYQLEYSLDAHGRPITKAVYVGGDYGFVKPDAADTRSKRVLVCLNIVRWLLFFGALLPQSCATRTAYCVLPFVACFLPLCYESAAIFVLMTANAPFRHDQADKLSERLPVSALLALIFSGAALIGFAVMAARILSQGIWVWGDAVFALLCALLTATSAVALRYSRRFKTHALNV